MKVFFAPIKTTRSQLDNLSGLFKKTVSFIKNGDLVAVKVHFGEYGNTSFIRPMYVRRIVEEIKKLGGKPFLVDTNTLYVGTRSNSVDHMETAIANGFGYSSVQAPIIIADGLKGKDSTWITIKKKNFDRVKISNAILEADCMVVVSHTKGHMGSGFGGTIKNLSMGCASRAGKLQMHDSTRPKVTATTCTACGLCAKYCPVDAIKIEEAAKIDQQVCIGCGECVVTCPTKAISISWNSGPVLMQEKMSEYAFGAVKDKQDKVAYFNFMMDITPDCDCFGQSDAPIVPDIGILASNDPVAIDQAAFDLIRKTKGLVNSRLKEEEVDDKFKKIHNIDGTIQISHSEKIGLGTRDYKLEKI